MIERDFVNKKLKEFKIQEFISETLKGIGHASTKLQKTPLGDKVIITSSRPGLVVGRKGSNIRKITNVLKNKFNLENPQVEIAEVADQYLDPNIVAERICSSLERFGTGRFKGIGHKMLQNAIDAGALGIEILISGKVPSSRARSWRFYQGYLKKCGDVAMKQVRKAKVDAHLKTGIVGIQVKIMPGDVKLPDKITLLDSPRETIEEISENKKSKSKKAKSSSKKKAPKKSKKIIDKKPNKVEEEKTK